MKRLFLAIIVFFISIQLFADANQTLYDKDDDEYRHAVVLCVSAGVTGPSSATPITGEELKIALDRIDKNVLPERLKALFEETYEKVVGNENTFTYDFEVDLTPQIFLTTDWQGNEGIIEDRRDFFLSYSDERPFLDLGVRLNFGNNVFIEGYLPLISGSAYKGMNLTSLDWLFNYRDNSWHFLWHGGPDLLSEIPTLARGSFGNKWINLIIGRTPHSMGSGYTGNFIISDIFQYQEVLALSINSNYFSYDLSLTHFDKQTGLETFEKEMFGGEHQNRVVHRFDINILDKARIILNFGATYYTDSAFDFRFFTPFMIAHNYYNSASDTVLENNVFDESNNIGSIEIEWNIMPKLQVSLQVVMDQFQLFYEDESALPNAFGTMANISWTELFNNATVTFWLEGVYTSPYLYLNEKYNKVKIGTDQDTGEDIFDLIPNYNYDWIVGYYRPGSRSPEINFSGHPFGPDTIAVAFGANYEDYDRNIWFKGSFLYRVHGIKGITNPTFDDDFQSASTPYGTAEHIIQVQGHAGWDIIKDTLELFGGVSFAYHVNYKNTQDRNVFIPQTYFGITYSII